MATFLSSTAVSVHDEANRPNTKIQCHTVGVRCMLLAWRSSPLLCRSTSRLAPPVVAPKPPFRFGLSFACGCVGIAFPGRCFFLWLWLRRRMGFVLRFGSLALSIRFPFAFSTSAFFLVAVIQAGQTILPHHVFVVVTYGLLLHDLGEHHRTDLFRLHPFFIQLVDFPDTVGGQRNPVFLTGISKPHQLFENIGFLQVCRSTLGFYALDVIWDIFKSVHVAIQLIVEAAFEFTALACQLEGIERKVLVACSGGRDGLEVGKPGRTAEFTPAGADTT